MYYNTKDNFVFSLSFNLMMKKGNFCQGRASTTRRIRTCWKCDLAESSLIINNSHYTVFHGIHANLQMTTYKVHKVVERY